MKAAIVPASAIAASGFSLCPADYIPDTAAVAAARAEAARANARADRAAARAAAAAEHRAALGVKDLTT